MSLEHASIVDSDFVLPCREPKDYTVTLLPDGRGDIGCDQITVEPGTCLAAEIDQDEALVFINGQGCMLLAYRLMEQFNRVRILLADPSAEPEQSTVG